MAITVNYKGNQIASFDSGTKTLKTAGKYCEGDINVSGDIYEKWRALIRSRTRWNYLFAYISSNTIDDDLEALNYNSLLRPGITDMSFMFYLNNATKIPTLNMTNITAASAMFNGCDALTTIDFVLNCIKTDISFSGSPALNDASLVSIANGLKKDAGKTLTLHRTPKARVTGNQIMGTVAFDQTGTYPIFTKDDNGSVSLAQFITSNDYKGWTLA